LRKRNHLVRIGTNIDEAARWLRKGELVAIPTETVYGLAGNALRTETVSRIFEVKNRPAFDPLIVHVGQKEQIAPLISLWPEQAGILAEAFWPGPLTMLFPKSDRIPDLVTAGSPLVAIRIPRHPLTLQLLALLNFPLAAPSANPFGYISPTQARHVADQLGRAIPYILDGGSCEIGLESTILSFAGARPLILRQGGIPREAIEACIGPVQAQTHSSSKPDAPGMLKSHYAPRARVVLLQRERVEPTAGTGALVFTEPLPGIPADRQYVLSARGDLREAAQRLFAGLRYLDGLDLQLILVELVPEKGLGRAINDRLRRASAAR